MVKKAVITIVTLIYLFCGMTISAGAEIVYQGDTIYYDGSAYAAGGLNYFRGEDLDSRGALISAESQMRNLGYVLCNSDRMEITQSEYDSLMRTKFWFMDYMTSENREMWKFDRVYVSQRALDEYMKSLNARTGAPSFEAVGLVDSTAVVLAYTVYNSKEKAGTLSDEYNENIPDYLDGAYMEIDSPIDMEVTLIHWGGQYYFRFYVTKDTPFMVKLPIGNYKVVNINGVRFSTSESSLPLYNMLLLDKSHSDRDHPLILNAEPVIRKYGIPDADLYGMPDLSIDKNQNIPEERTVVDIEALEKAKLKAEAAIAEDEAAEAQREQEKQDRLSKSKDPNSEEAKAEEEAQEKETKKNRMKSAAAVTAVFVIVISLFKAVMHKIKGKSDDENDDDDVL